MKKPVSARLRPPWIVSGVVATFLLVGGGVYGATHPVNSEQHQALATPTALPSPVPTPTADLVMGNGGVVVLTGGIVLPNSARTPGATNPDVTQDTIDRTICVIGWTTSIRPPSSVTTALKIRQLASGYAYQGDTATIDYEEDHLISLELGGAPSAETNLWPEPYKVTEGARVKDRVENKLHALVCSGAITLVAAQTAIATNWWTAYQSYIGTVSATATAPPLAPALQLVPVIPAPGTSVSPVTPGGTPTALCNDGHYSYAAHHRGACSGHGGVAIFYK